MNNPKCPNCKYEGNDKFKWHYVDINEVYKTLKAFDTNGNPIYGNIVIKSGGKSKYITCPACGFQGKPFQFNRNALKGCDK